VLGLTPTDDGLSVLARASQKLVVNVARRGGVVVAAGRTDWAHDVCIINRCHGLR
jgi:hypothetical protein